MNKINRKILLLGYMDFRFFFLIRGFKRYVLFGVGGGVCKIFKMCKINFIVFLFNVGELLILF